MIAELKERTGSVAVVARGNAGDLLAGEGAALYSEHFTTIVRRPRRFHPAGGVAANGESTIRHE